MSAQAQQTRLEQQLVAAEERCRQIMQDSDRECQRLAAEAHDAREDARMLTRGLSEETLEALRHNDWAARLQLWHRRALAAEEEVGEREECSCVP